MRQVFLQNPWLHDEEPEEIKEIFFRYGKPERLKRGTVVFNGGHQGRFYYLKSGLAVFSFEDKYQRQMIFNLVLPGRVFADVDGVTRDLVNVIDSVIRPSEVLSIDYETWYKYIGSNPALLLLTTRGIIAKHESHMEAMIANYTLTLNERLRVLLKVLLHAYGHEIVHGWNKIPLYLSTGEYAALVGASRISVSRIFSIWIKEGLLQKEKRNLIAHSKMFEGIYDWVDAK